MFILQRSVQCLSAIVTPVSVKVFKESMNVWMNELITVIMNFMAAPCINNIKHFIFKIMHTNYRKKSLDY